MSFMFEVYYKAPPDPRREEKILDVVSQGGGALTFREAPSEVGPRTICLTCEFEDLEAAQVVADRLVQEGEYVEGPSDYGP